MPVTRIYIRASTEKQSASPARQATLCRDYHSVMNTHSAVMPPLFPQVYQDRATSGSIPFDSRPAGHALLVDCERLDHVIVDAYDRVGRDVPDMLNVVRLFAKRGVVVHMLNMLILSKIDPDDPMSEFMLTQVASISQMERKMISQRTKRGKAARRMQGYLDGGTPPIGFKAVPNPECDLHKWKSDRNYKVPRHLIVPFPEDKEYWDRAWQMWSNGAKVPEIVERLKDSPAAHLWPSRRLWRRLDQRRKELEAEAFRQERQKVFQL